MEFRSQKRFFCQWELRYMGVNRQPDVVDVSFAALVVTGFHNIQCRLDA